MSSKNKITKTSKKLQTNKISEQIAQHPDIKLVKKIASISERAERSRPPLVLRQTNFYKL